MALERELKPYEAIVIEKAFAFGDEAGHKAEYCTIVPVHWMGGGTHQTNSDRLLHHRLF